VNYRGYFERNQHQNEKQETVEEAEASKSGADILHRYSPCTDRVWPDQMTESQSDGFENEQRFGRSTINEARGNLLLAWEV
jgi:hypothetical protein